ncbi:MAG: hypothetical protein ABIS06_10115 [Vicinamibacterales bacterium]
MVLVWDYNYLIPYSYIAIDYTRTVQSRVKQRSRRFVARAQVV